MDTNINFGVLPLGKAPVNGVTEVQLLTSTASGGTFTITFTNPYTGASATTTAIDWNATKAAIQLALDALANMPAGGVVVGGAAASLNLGALSLTFAGSLAGLNIAQVTCDNTSATGGTVVPSTSIGGVKGSYRGVRLGTLVIDTANGDMYENTGTATVPLWTVPIVS